MILTSECTFWIMTNFFFKVYRYFALDETFNLETLEWCFGAVDCCTLAGCVRPVIRRAPIRITFFSGPWTSEWLDWGVAQDEFRVPVVLVCLHMKEYVKIIMNKSNLIQFVENYQDQYMILPSSTPTSTSTLISALSWV